MSGTLGRGVYHTLRWKALRRHVFERDGYRCRLCGNRGRLECDHIVPLRGGQDPFEIRNLQTLCRSCHIDKTSKQNRKPESPDVAAWRKKLSELFEEQPKEAT